MLVCPGVPDFTRETHDKRYSGMVMDWREMAGRPTVRMSQDAWSLWNTVWSGGRQVGSEGLHEGHWDGRIDPVRGWLIAACWIIASTAE